MKSLIILTILILFSSTSVYSAINCEGVKKTSPKYLLCKTGSGLSSIKNKFSKKNELKKETQKKSFFKKFGEAKTLSDL